MTTLFKNSTAKKLLRLIDQPLRLPASFSQPAGPENSDSIIRICKVTSIVSGSSAPYKYKADLCNARYDQDGGSAAVIASDVDLWSPVQLQVGDQVHAAWSYGNHWEAVGGAGAGTNTTTEIITHDDVPVFAIGSGYNNLILIPDGNGGHKTYLTVFSFGIAECLVFDRGTDPNYAYQDKAYLNVIDSREYTPPVDQGLYSVIYMAFKLPTKPADAECFLGFVYDCYYTKNLIGNPVIEEDMHILSVGTTYTNTAGKLIHVIDVNPIIRDSQAIPQGTALLIPVATFGVINSPAPAHWGFRRLQYGAANF
jgi:hypothetical protein